jgi:hypothetical protein
VIEKLSCQRYFAGSLVERDELAVELPDINLAVAETQAAARPAAADDADRVVEAGAIRPQDVARVDVDREHVVRARDDVERAVVHERLRFARILRADTRAA